MYCEQCVQNRLQENLNICADTCKGYEKTRISPVFFSLLYKIEIECENKNNGCDAVLPYMQLEEHQQKDCPYKMMTCRGCHANILKNKLDEHEEKCGEIEIRCKICRLIYKQKEKHDDID